ncbi:carboxymuconolactone decarboxylase family protein [Oceanicola sp. D3]|uniref:carboxymuconolactone decarboxylase family protein n=1 Tax=Oceanicola sp. D3 TaxID=2587163 RepID=UPI0011205859|nr:carboxymuconolactone decarboxylase family protein [Oceanicola sp. D3]QDC10425.1 carboxymuconolactone decarboxylase family protein [Oceanicola sp. D3]
MTPRVDITTAAPKLMTEWLKLSNTVEAAGLDPALCELVKLRASQINGCANCLNMHSFAASGQGETPQRLHLLPAWEDAPCYTPRERAALAWTDHLTQVSTRRAPKAVYAALAAEFDPAEQVTLTMLINVINGWNRLAIGFDQFVPEYGWT